MATAECAEQVGVEFAEHVAAGVDAKVKGVLAEDAAGGFLGRRVIAGRGESGEACADHFAGVERLLAGVGANDEGAGEGVDEAPRV